MTSLERVKERVIDRIIVPLDVARQAEAIALVDRLPQVTFWKVGLELFVSGGPTILSQLKSRGKRIFLDLKLHDIPNTMAGAGRAAGYYGVEFLTVHAAAGRTALSAVQQAAIEGAQQSGNPPPRVIAITLLTSISAEVLASELNVSMTVEDYVKRMAQLAKTSGLAGAVCSPYEAMVLRELCGEDFWLVCPGIRPRWAQKSDQQRVMTPSNALEAGADYLVIGRPITQAADPAAAIERICAEMAA